MRGKLIIILSVLILAFFLVKTIQADKGISEGREMKISEKVLEQVERGDQVRVYIKLKTEMKKGRAIASENVKEEISDILGNKVKHVFDDGISAIISEEELLELQNNSNIEVIGEVKSRSIFLQQSVPLINSSTELWSVQMNGINLTGEGQTVCVIDTGVNYSNPDLGGCWGDNNVSSSCKVIGGWDYCANNINCTDEDSDPIEESTGSASSHGTHVAGIVAANGSIKGVAPGAKIVMIKAANSTGTFWDDDIKKAIDWCVANSSMYNISVISMSLGGGFFNESCDEYIDGDLTDQYDVVDLSSSINAAVAKNISVVIATGNDANKTHIAAPACAVNATPIGGTDKSDVMYSNGNRNSLVFLLSPGVLINSTLMTGYGSKSGTSMATPHASGAIAIINQYKKLEGIRNMTPSEIENALNDSGKVIDDSGGSGLNYSRIQVYQTILAIDESAPGITLNSPSHDSMDSNENQTFNCSATDIQLKNLTFYLWNCSDALINETIYNATSNNFSIEINQTLGNGTYHWNCLGYDNQSNYAWASSNYTLRIGAIGVILNSPSHNSYTKVNLTTFNCSVQSTIAEIKNVTLRVWNSSNIIVYNETQNLTGTDNQTTFDYNLTREGQYKWNCLAYDEDSNFAERGLNYTLTFDKTSPNVTLINPADETSQTSTTVNFRFNVTDANSITNCSLIIDDDVEETETSITKDTTETITISLDEDTYYWKIGCYDIVGNLGESFEWEININLPDDETDSTGTTSSSGGTTTTPTTTPTQTTTTPPVITYYDISQEEFETGYSKLLTKEEGVTFTKGNESHRLELERISNESVIVKIYSNPIILTILLGSTEKADINNDNIYDVAVTYNEYLGSSANISVKSINETIGVRTIFEEEFSWEEKIRSTIIRIKLFLTNLSKTTKIILISSIGVIILGIAFFIFYVIRKRRNEVRGVYKKKYSQIFKIKEILDNGGDEI